MTAGVLRGRQPARQPAGVNPPADHVRWKGKPMIHHRDLLTAARAEALFTSHLSADSPLSPDQVAAAIKQAIRAHGGTRGCAAAMAAAYGDHPETAAPRMRWALRVVDQLYTDRDLLDMPPGARLRYRLSSL
jgi:hypothetical protein